MLNFSDNQIYIVTGASAGIGEETALLLNKCGATVISIARNEERLNSMKAKCKFPENMHIEVKDLAEDIENLPQYVKELREKYGKFSGMAYCAGVIGVEPLQCIDYENLKRVFDVNYFAAILMIKAVANKKNNIGKGTSIACVSSLAAVRPSKAQTIYAGTKGALSASIKSIAQEVAPFGIRINCVLPSMIKTQMNARNPMFEEAEKISNEYPFGWGKPDDVANMLIYLLSNEAKYLSGQNYIIDSGGML